MSDQQAKRPNIIFIMSDDHAAHAIGCYGSQINKTPNIDRIASEGMRLDNCFCTNAICTPSRASILTGTYNHVNGVKTLSDRLDGRQLTVSKLLQENGYQTAIVGKWHLGHGEESDPTGFDFWSVVPGQGDYIDPAFIEMGRMIQVQGYATDIITDKSIEWMEQRDVNKPFFLMCHHKAPHRPWIFDEKHAHMYEDIDIPEPVTFNDDYANRATAAAVAEMRIDRDLTVRDLKMDPPAHLEGAALKSWKYQRYIKDYLRCIASIDDNVGRMLDYLEQEGLSEDTIVIYTSDQGFFLGDHGWYDKRFMYEESLRMPFVIRYPRKISQGTSSGHMVLNVDFAPLFLSYAGVEVPESMQGVSFHPILEGNNPADWRTSMYYRYWMHLSEHKVYAHYGIRTEQYKLIYYYADALGTLGSEDEPKVPEWELFDLKKDPYEMINVYHDPDYERVAIVLERELYRLQEELGDERFVNQD